MILEWKHIYCYIAESGTPQVFVTDGNRIMIAEFNRYLDPFHETAEFWGIPYDENDEKNGITNEGFLARFCDPISPTHYALMPSIKRKPNNETT
jgi:hypothetical protein